MLEDSKVHNLQNHIRDSFRIRPNHKPVYEDVSGNLIRFSSKQHQVIFGRRGSGKSCLFVHFLNDKKANNGILPIYIEGDELKRLSYPDLLVRLLLEIFEKIELKISFWSKLNFFRKKLVKEHIKDLRNILARAEEMEVRETGVHNKQKKASITKSGINAAGTITQNHARESEFKEFKIDQLERYLSDYKKALSSSLKILKYDSVFVMLDDFYLLPRSRQPDIIDYLHRLTRGIDFYLKVGTVRHRTSIMRNDESTIGIELHQDVEEISLDRTFEDMEATGSYLSRMLESVANKVGLYNTKECLFNSDAFHALVLASGGVPRDFLNIFVGAISASLDDGKTQWVTPKYIWKSASRFSYKTKLKSLNDEGVSDSSQLEKLYTDIVYFCLIEKKKTAFLVSQEQTNEHALIHELVQQLMDFKLIHIIVPDTSAASGRKGRFEAYTLDYSLFMEPRMRNIDHVNFWKIDDRHRREGVREAPVYDLNRAEGILNENLEVSDIEETIKLAQK